MYKPDNIEIEIQCSPNERFKTFAVLLLHKITVYRAFLSPPTKLKKYEPGL